MKLLDHKFYKKDKSAAKRADGGDVLCNSIKVKATVLTSTRDIYLKEVYGMIGYVKGPRSHFVTVSRSHY